MIQTFIRIKPKINVVNKSLYSNCPKNGKCNVVTLESKYTRTISLIDVDGVFRNMRYLDINTVNNVNNNEKIPTLLLMGTAQTISTYGPHLRGLSKNKRLIIPELRSQGETELLSNHCNMKQHVQGFSFGGRVGCALAANVPSLVGRLSLTGVPLVRPALGSLIINSWRESMIEGNIRDSAWSFVLNGYNDSFIEQNHTKLEQFVDIVVKNNDPIKLRDLLVGSNSQSQENYSVAFSAEKIICPTQIIGCTHDRIAGLASVKDLDNVINKKESQFYEIESGHLAPFQKPIEWRQVVMNFIENIENIKSSNEQSNNV